MSAIHLAKGSTQPAKVDGKLRLYSMHFCPFAERVRLVLLVKGIPHDIVNVHLKNKPDWIFNLHPEGKVPVLDTGSQVIIESLDISDFLDEQYPEPPLYPKDPQKRTQDKAIIQQFGKLIAVYYEAVYNSEKKSFDEHIQLLKPYVQQLENELQKRGLYFGGDKPNMVDYMIWPWGERAQVLERIFNQKIPAESEYPRLYSWCKAMRTQKAVQETETSTDRSYQLVLQYRGAPDAVNYDII